MYVSLFILGVGMRRTGDIEGVRQSSGNWQRGDNISWTKRLICEPLEKSKVAEMSQRMCVMPSIFCFFQLPGILNR